MFGFDREFIRTDPLEVVVEEPIEDGVGANRGDANEVEEHEEGHHVLGVVEQVRHLCHEAEQAAKISRNHLCLYKAAAGKGFLKRPPLHFSEAREPLKQRQKPEREPGKEEGERDGEENDVGLPLLPHQTWLGNSVLLKSELT